MTIILSITLNDHGQYEITDKGGKVVEGPFETNAGRALYETLPRFSKSAQFCADPKRVADRQELDGAA